MSHFATSDNCHNNGKTLKGKQLVLKGKNKIRNRKKCTLLIICQSCFSFTV